MKIIDNLFPEPAMEIIAENSLSEVEVADQLVRSDDLREITSLQLAMVGGGLGVATLI